MLFSRRKAAATALVFGMSAGLHSSVLFHQEIGRSFNSAANYLADKYEKYQIRKEREELIEQAREDLKNGTLRLGEFMLKGNELDSREEGKQFDLKEARARYDGYVGKMPAPCSGSCPSVMQAVPEIFKDLDYYGVPGGRMGDAIMEGGGSCDQLSQLIASAVYDSGYKEEAYLRHYSANAENLSHITPIFSQGDEEYDLVAGTKSDRKGTKFHASELVEAYARAHGLAPPLPFPAANPGDSAVASSPSRSIPSTPEGKPSGLSYPPAKDSYSGGAPLFSSRAVKPFNPDAEGPANSSDTEKPEGTNAGNAGAGGTKEKAPWHHEPTDEELLSPTYFGNPPSSNQDSITKIMVVTVGQNNLMPDLLSKRIENAKMVLNDALGKVAIGAAVRSVGSSEEGVVSHRAIALRMLGKLSGFYGQMEWHAVLLRKHHLAKMARDERDKIIEKASGLFDKIDPKKEIYLTDTWELAYLGSKGQDVLFRLLEEPIPEESHIQYLTRERSLAYLVAQESTRERAVAILDKLNAQQKLNIFSMINPIEFEGIGELYRGYSAYSYLLTTPFDPSNDETEAVSGIINRGESLPVSNYLFTLDGIDSRQMPNVAIDMKEFFAVISIKDQNGKILKKDIIPEGETKTFTLEGREYPVKVRKISPGFNFDAEFADIALLSKTGYWNFTTLVNEVRSVCQRFGLGKDWETAFIVLRGQGLVGRIGAVQGNPFAVRENLALLLEFHDWLETNQITDHGTPDSGFSLRVSIRSEINQKREHPVLKEACDNLRQNIERTYAKRLPTGCSDDL